MSDSSSDNFQPAQTVVPCPDLAEAIEFFTNRLGFRLEMVVPADSPRAAVVFGHGIRFRLEFNQVSEELSLDAEGLVISRVSSADAWHVGRAGMQYRDLIPGKLGGRFIASHIRIPDGGEVPDYVHYHKVRFQMIYCKAGWVRVVYEDQGEPFVLQPGDCVLQAPEIRHRVLEASPGLEVIEIGSPAIHETYVDHELQLPTGRVLPERCFGGQRFVRHIAGEADWIASPIAGCEMRDTGISAATNGLASARVHRFAVAASATAHRHEGEFLFLFVLKGELGFENSEEGKQQLMAGDCCVIPAAMEFTLRASEGLELLEVNLPAGARPEQPAKVALA
ncbi:MAG: cupin domain-containing protein [Acidobacteria bacterium]|nr:cupin domain-containing protein [Acidobacteriota bacterium]